MKYILASKSPRRKELLSQLISNYEIIEADCNEICNQTDPPKIVETLAERKAKSVANQIVSGHADFNLTSPNEEIKIIGSDTIVVHDREVFGKPQDENHAYKMLKALQDSWHSVFTGICVITIKDNQITNTFTYHEETKVHMVPLHDEQISTYIQTGEPMDKAGAYAIQGYGGKFIDEIDGEFETVMGLSLKKLKTIL